MGIGMQKVRITLPEKVNEIIKTLEAAGYEAYAVGGCIRDSLLSRKANDWDITTSASPTQVKELFWRTVDTGIAHGTVTVMSGGEGFEVTTYRIDGEYEDSRHPKEVTFTSELAEDLRRRDFTINAMAYNETAGIVDLFGGQEDLKNKVIRCVGSPDERFDEDALRILRAFRFSAQLGFSVEEDTKRAAKERAEHLRKISAERIRTELTKLLVSDHPERLLEVAECGITRVVLPEFDAMLATPQNNRNHQFDVGNHTLQTVSYIADREKQEAYLHALLPDFPADSVLCTHEWGKKERQILRWAALLHDAAKPKTAIKDAAGEDHFPKHAEQGALLAGEILRRLRFDNETIDNVCRLTAAHDYYHFERSERGMRHLLCRFGTVLPELLWELQLADVLAQSTETLELKVKDLVQIKQLYQTVMERGDCVSLKQLAVTGKDLIECGAKEGPELGEELEKLLHAVLDCPERNEKEQLMELYQSERKKAVAGTLPGQKEKTADGILPE